MNIKMQVFLQTKKKIQGPKKIKIECCDLSAEAAVKDTRT